MPAPTHAPAGGRRKKRPLGTCWDWARGSPGSEVREPRNLCFLAVPAACRGHRPSVGPAVGGPSLLRGHGHVLRKRSTRVCCQAPAPGGDSGRRERQRTWSGAPCSPCPALCLLPPPSLLPGDPESSGLFSHCGPSRERARVRPDTLLSGPVKPPGPPEERSPSSKLQSFPATLASHLCPLGSQPLPTRGHLRESQPFAFGVLLAPRLPRPALSWDVFSGKDRDRGQRTASPEGERSR